MPFDPPLRCPWRCHEIGGPWITVDPACPFHGTDPVDLDELDEDTGRRMVAEQEQVLEDELERERRFYAGEEE